MKRKSLAESLSSEAQDFIDAGTPRPSKSTEDVAHLVLVSQTYRLPQSLVTALIRASADRKIARRKPWSQQEIVAQALQEWLDKNVSK